MNDAMSDDDILKELLQAPIINAPAMVPDPINPQHYKTAAGIEAIDVIEAFGLGFHLGNAVKYILRAGKKDPARFAEDLKKAQWYINRAVEARESPTGKEA